MVKAGSQDVNIRLKRGLERERQVADALRIQIGLPIEDASKFQDHERKVDRWIAYPGQKRVALQIKYREVGKDLLFEVFDKWFAWDDQRNKLGRDMFGDAKEYAVLLSDQKTVVMVPTLLAKNVINEMVSLARVNGFTIGNNFHYFVHGVKLVLKVQKDPADQRQKMVAYIPPDYFVAEQQANVYQVVLPRLAA